MARKKRSPEETDRRAKIRELQQLANVSSMDDIQNQQLRLGQRPFQLAQMIVVLGFAQFRRKRCRILKQGIVSLGAGFQAQSNCQMGLASVGINHKDKLDL